MCALLPYTCLHWGARARTIAARMSFPLGKASLAMIGLAALCAAAMLFRPPPPRADLRLWVFAEPHARMYRDARQGRSLVQQFQAETGKSVSVEVVATAAL